MSAIAEPEDREQPSASSAVNGAQGAVELLKSSVDGFFQRYDVVSAGMGALVVTSVCVKNGQDPATAIWITLSSTVVALVLHEVLFNKD